MKTTLYRIFPFDFFQFSGIIITLLQHRSSLFNTETCETKVATLRKCFLTSAPQLIIRLSSILLDLAKGQVTNDLDSVLRDLLQSTNEGRPRNETDEVCLFDMIVHVSLCAVFLIACVWVYLYCGCYGATALVPLTFCLMIIGRPKDHKYSDKIITYIIYF